jgi:hypothetical protein
MNMYPPSISSKVQINCVLFRIIIELADGRNGGFGAVLARQKYCRQTWRQVCWVIMCPQALEFQEKPGQERQLKSWHPMGRCDANISLIQIEIIYIPVA